MTTFINLTVLILVLMEDTLRGDEDSAAAKSKRSLNPCFNGRYSQSDICCIQRG